MKRIFIYLAILAVFATTACSEDFLNISPVGAVDEAALLNEDGLKWVVTGMYSTLYSSGPTGTLSNYVYGDNLGGNCNKGSASSDQPSWTSLETYVITADNSYLSSKWTNCYNGVFRSNVVLDMLTKMTSELEGKAGEEKDYIIETEAEARFFRGFWHFEALKVFGAAIPYVGLEDYQASVNPQVSNIDDAGNYIYIWDKIMEDFEFAYENLPSVWKTDDGRINKWTALAMLAKVQVFYASPYNGTNGTDNSDASWTDVKTTIETLMASGVDNKGTAFKLHSNYYQLFEAGKSDWTGESVFDVQSTISGTQTNTNQAWASVWNNLSSKLTASGWGFLSPSTDLAQSYYVDENGLPYLDGAYREQPDMQWRKVVNGATTSIVETNLGLYTDPRIDANLGRFNVPFYDWGTFTSIDGVVREVTNGGLYYGKKHINKKSDYGTYTVTSDRGSAKNVHLIRWADVLLWYAEACIELEDYGTAMDYVNQVRARAANYYIPAATGTTNYSMDDQANAGANNGTDAAANYRIGLWTDANFADYESSMKALRAERRAELALEGHLWFDQCRWNTAYDDVTGYLAFEKYYLSRFVNKAYSEEWVTLAIPDSEIKTMQGLLVQNEGWD